MSKLSEEFVRNYLRLNGFFTVDNFIVHAADDKTRITDNGHVGNYTETDILAIRLPNSVEISGQLLIANDLEITEGQNGKIDIIVAEVKTGNQKTPNTIWKHADDLNAKEYLLKFIGCFNSEEEIKSAAKTISENYIFKNETIRIRYIIFSKVKSNHYIDKGVKYITYDHMVDFLTEVRGQSWSEAGIGVASVHQQWPGMLKDIFTIINNDQISFQERKKTLFDYIQINGEQKH